MCSLSSPDFSVGINAGDAFGVTWIEVAVSTSSCPGRTPLPQTVALRGLARYCKYSQLMAGMELRRFPHRSGHNLLDSCPMSTFVLVHGAWQSTGTWDLLTPLLQERGHRVITPILHGLGSDQGRLTPELALHHHVDDIGTALANLTDKAVLVGHSYAGMVISGAVESHPTKVQRLVFLDAFIPENGQCALDLLPPE